MHNTIRHPTKNLKMIARRKFIQKIGLGSVLASQAASLVATKVYTEKPITIGIIGAENSHTAGYGKLFNIDKKFPGVDVKYVWGETDDFAAKAMKAGHIPLQVKDPREMLGKINALIVDHRHAKYHLTAAYPFIEAGIPTFIDKPFCYRSVEGKEFLEMARKKGTPVSSYSAIAHTDGTFELKEKIKSIKDIHQVVCTGTADLDSEYGGIFFYGVHIIEPLMYVFGEDITEVKVTRNHHQGSANIRFASGLFATIIFKTKAYGWETFIETNSGFIQLKPTVAETEPGRNYKDMVEMFRSGKESRPHQSILNGISVLEALESSAYTEKWTEVIYQKLN